MAPGQEQDLQTLKILGETHADLPDAGTVSGFIHGVQGGGTGPPECGRWGRPESSSHETGPGASAAILCGHTVPHELAVCRLGAESGTWEGPPDVRPLHPSSLGSWGVLVGIVPPLSVAYVGAVCADASVRSRSVARLRSSRFLLPRLKARGRLCGFRTSVCHPATSKGQRALSGSCARAHGASVRAPRRETEAPRGDPTGRDVSATLAGPRNPLASRRAKCSSAP